MTVTIKRLGKAHFTKHFDCGATSDRRVLPGKDGTWVKVTHVHTVKGAEWEYVKYPFDEVVFVHKGEVELKLTDGVKHVLKTGDLYVANEGDVYTLRDHHGDAELICVFSRAGHTGIPVDDT
jgi:quercetin dioxygenase-like cupin family protein